MVQKFAKNAFNKAEFNKDCSAFCRPNAWPSLEFRAVLTKLLSNSL